MARYINTERVGVNETESIVIKQLDWIFREQPIIDVGLDAIIEQSEEGNPTGRFIAVQIKTGKSNFHISDKKLTHYVSHIHYNYWLNLDIPIILIAHLPETGKTYWQYICESNFRKTNKRWKIEIPKVQEFNGRSKSKLIQILSNKNHKNFAFDLFLGKVEPDNVYDFAEDTECISESVACILNIASIISDLNDKNRAFNTKLSGFIDNGLSDKDLQVKASIKGNGKTLNICSKRLESEILLFSELYSIGFYAYEQVISIHYLITQDSKGLDDAITSLEKIPQAVDEAIEEIKYMRNSISNLPKKYAVLKEARNLLVNVVDMLIVEFLESKKMAEGIREKVERKLSSKVKT